MNMDKEPTNGNENKQINSENLTDEEKKQVAMDTAKKDMEEKKKAEKAEQESTKSKSGKGKEKAEKYPDDGQPVEFKNTPEEVLEEIKKIGDDATYIGEENGCWKFKSIKDSIEYEYCKDEGILHETEFITIGQ